MWRAGKVGKAGVLVKGATSKVNQSRLERGWHDQYIFEFDVTVEDVALGTMLQAVNDLFQNFPVLHSSQRLIGLKEWTYFASLSLSRFRFDT